MNIIISARGGAGSYPAVAWWSLGRGAGPLASGGACDAGSVGKCDRRLRRSIIRTMHSLRLSYVQTGV